MIQNHGKLLESVHNTILMTPAGVGAADITKLKAAGYWTVTVSPRHTLQLKYLAYQWS
jgi:hypothetical protein